MSDEMGGAQHDWRHGIPPAQASDDRDEYGVPTVPALLLNIAGKIHRIEELEARVRELEDGIRQHRDVKADGHAHSPVPEDEALWALLPDQGDNVTGD